MNDRVARPVHWSFWVIGAAGLVFNLLGCMNYISQMNSELVASMPDVYRAIVERRPAWGTGAFAIAVFGGALGCLLLLLRKSIAAYMFIASLVGAAIAQLPFVGMVDFPVGAWIGSLSQLVVGGFYIWYSKEVESKGWLG